MVAYKKRKYSEGDFNFWVVRVLVAARKRSKLQNKKFTLTSKDIRQIYKNPKKGVVL
jgi:hypothetical protein